MDGLVQERHNSSALAIELCLSWINIALNTNDIKCKPYAVYATFFIILNV